MATLQETHSLDEFNQNAKTHVRRLKRTGLPEVLTVNGLPAVVIQDAGSYQRLLDAVEKAEAIAGIKRGLGSMERGEGESAKTVFSRLRRKYKIPAEA